MSVKTKMGVASFVALGIVAAAAFYLFDPSKYRDRDWVLVSMVVTFKPVLRSEAIDILAAINGHPALHEQGHESPWQESASAIRGSTVSLAAVEPFGTGYMDCAITAHGRTVGPLPANLTPRPGTQGCLVSITV